MSPDVFAVALATIASGFMLPLAGYASTARKMQWPVGQLYETHQEPITLFAFIGALLIGPSFAMHLMGWKAVLATLVGMWIVSGVVLAILRSWVQVVAPLAAVGSLTAAAVIVWRSAN